ncbi:MAG: hypothetical protein WB441_10255 [Nocardioidaceae bacterium]
MDLHRDDVEVQSPRRPWWSRLVARLLWAVAVVGSLDLLVRGLWMTTYVEPTGDALRRASWGGLVTTCGCLLLLLTAAYVHKVVRSPGWVGAAVLTPAVVCGGLALLASETLLPILSVLVAFPVAGVGIVGGVLVPGVVPTRSTGSPARS